MTLPPSDSPSPPATSPVGTLAPPSPELAAFAKTLSDRYAIQRELGRGAMATVYLARDVKHDREVAIKVLNPELGAVLGVERFLSEIRVTATLQHPNLLPLFDSGEANGLLFYVMPFVDGESLRATLDREKQLPVEDAVRIATAVATALAYAHERGVIHRDLKPENILLQAGQPVVADFGIALAVSNAGGQRVTQTGLSLGTPQYMSPEQATGDRAVDRRADVYSLAAVTYEMLAGEPPHSAPTSQAIIAKLMTEEVRPITTLRRSVPDHIDRALARGLEKLAADRFGTATEFAEVLNGRLTVAPPRRHTVTGRVSRSLAIGATAFVGGALLAWFARPAPNEIERLEVYIPADQPLTNLGGGYPPPYGVRDGSAFFYSGTDSTGVTHLYRRGLGTATADVVPGVSGEVARGWVMPSPDGTRLAVLTVPGLRTFVASSAGGEPRLLTDSLFGVIAWGRDDDMIYGVHSRTEVVSRIPATGGPIEQLTRPDTTRQSGHWMPDPLPGGKGVLITIRSGGPDRAAAALVAVVDPKGTVKLLTEGFAARFADPGYVVFARGDGVLYAATFDIDRLEMGKPVPVVHGVSIDATGFFAYYSLAPDGALLYLPASQTSQRNRLVWVDRSGREPGPAIGVEDPFIGHPRLSPDGQTIAFEFDWDVALRTLATSTTTQLSKSFGGNGWYANPQWATNEMLTMGGLPRGGTWHLYRFARDRPGVEHPLLPGQSGITESLSRPGGRGLVFVVQSRERGAIRYTTSDTSTTSVSFADPTTDQHGIALSPDGNWLAYLADREVWVSAFPGGGARLQVSQNGGSEPRWSHDGARLFYRALDSLFAADIRRSPRLGIGARTALFSAHDYASDPRVANYDVAPDDQRFLFVKVVGEETRPKFFVVERNWVGRLHGLVGR